MTIITTVNYTRNPAAVQTYFKPIQHTHTNYNTQSCIIHDEPLMWLIFWFNGSRLNPKTTNKKMRRRKGLGSVQPLYRVFTSFWPWSVCDRCGVPGEQVRVGLCYIQSYFLHVRYRQANQTVASCGSGAVPRAFRNLNNGRVGAKLEVKSCQVTCPTQAPPSSKVLALMTFLGYK